GHGRQEAGSECSQHETAGAEKICRTLGRAAENEKISRKEDYEMFMEKLREAGSVVSAEQPLTENHRQESLLLAKDLGRLRWAISQSQVEVIENDPTSVEEVILAQLCAGEVKETEIVLKSDGKMRLSVMVALNGVTRHLTGSMLNSACFNGLADMEEFRVELLERGVAVPS
ncbi:hypothetical protein ANCCAN_19855, partial [Ancylostoma caninum]